MFTGPGHSGLIPRRLATACSCNTNSATPEDPRPAAKAGENPQTGSRLDLKKFKGNNKGPHPKRVL
ncbi:hypothetical protein GGTG_12112 [Gaeumannomyces tritici R3-111a-1]|uniref:Uncharacterized protein n=1 Tax=Gaeumannomyces tritici (strain R3-111a-1) TaxID=644352 RepID=J3PF33_GAET3|nr:hypothetical protein GGTG_12112 [Gaeumannomyces tritici R3-111a-1]EJT71091.1 hypothetical protein GGTG_12112 [Gaeumannomyces tritici R3-111a-1]